MSEQVLLLSNPVCAVLSTEKNQADIDATDGYAVVRACVGRQVEAGSLSEEFLAERDLYFRIYGKPHFVVIGDEEGVVEEGAPVYRPAGLQGSTAGTLDVDAISKVSFVGKTCRELTL